MRSGLYLLTSRAGWARFSSRSGAARARTQANELRGGWRVNDVRVRTIGAVAGSAALVLLATPGAAQNYVTESVCPVDAHAEFHRCAMEAAPNFDPPRTASGQPDFSGLWRRRAAAHEDIQEHPTNPDDSGGPSAIVDPADGIAPLQPWAEQRRADHEHEYVHHNAACLLSGVPVTMYMTGLYQFIQTEDHVVITSEEAHPWRSIPLDGRPHIGADIKLWQGDSRGRWEGNTLVVDTTNLNGIPWLDQVGRFVTSDVHVTERFTMVDANTLHWQATIEDPNVFTRPFTLALAYRRNAVDGMEVWEEACHENNATNMHHFLDVGYEIFPGISPEEARAAREAFEGGQR
jgi:hypothetical protein